MGSVVPCRDESCRGAHNGWNCIHKTVCSLLRIESYGCRSAHRRLSCLIFHLTSLCWLLRVFCHKTRFACCSYGDMVYFVVRVLTLIHFARRANNLAPWSRCTRLCIPIRYCLTPACGTLLTLTIMPTCSIFFPLQERGTSLRRCYLVLPSRRERWCRRHGPRCTLCLS